MDSVAVTGMHRTQPRLVGDAFLLIGVDRLKAEHAPIEFDRSCRAFDVERRFKDSVHSIWTPMFEQEEPVRVLGYTWAGVRANNLNSSSRFFSDILGLRPASALTPPQLAY